MIELPSEVDSTLFDNVMRRYALEMNLQKVQQTFDIFFCSAGYEERTMGFLENAPSELMFNQAIIFLYHPAETPLYLKNLQNLEKIKKKLKLMSANEPIIVEINPIDPWRFRETLKETFGKYSINPTRKVLVDATSFTRVFLYEIIKSLYSSECSFLIAYTEPEDYVSTMAAGVNKLVIAPSFMGKPRPNNKTFLLIFFGWETGRSKDTFDNFNSDDHIGVIGVQPIDEKHIDWQYESLRKNRDLINIIKNVRFAPTLEVEEICKFINDVYLEKLEEYEERKEKFDFAISGFGPKVQNIAIALFALTHKGVQLVYGAPSYWAASTDANSEIHFESHGIGTSYLYGPFNKDTIDKRFSFKPH